MTDLCHRVQVTDHPAKLGQRFSMVVVGGSLGLGAVGGTALGVAAGMTVVGPWALIGSLVLSHWLRSCWC